MIGLLLADIRIARRMLARDWRSGELTILAVALIIAAASVSSVGFFVERVQKAMDQQAAELLAADLVVGSTRAIATVYTEEAQRLHLRQAWVMSFRSVVISETAPQLVEVKAVSDHYPLRGRIKTASVPFAETLDTLTHGPARGEVWVPNTRCRVNPNPVKSGSRRACCSACPYRSAIPCCLGQKHYVSVVSWSMNPTAVATCSVSPRGS